MIATANFFGVERANHTVVLTPQGSLDELAYHEIEPGVTDLFAALETSSVRNVILDLRHSGYLGSSALNFRDRRVIQARCRMQ